MCHFINTVRNGRIKKHKSEAQAPQEGSRRDWHFQIWEYGELIWISKMADSSHRNPIYYQDIANFDHKCDT